MNKRTLFVTLVSTVCLACIWLSCAEGDDEITGNTKLSGMQSDASELLADGVSQVTLVATVLDSAGYPLQGALVKFTCSAGTITPRSYSDMYGQAVATLTSLASVTDVTALVSAELVVTESARMTAGQLYALDIKDRPSPARVRLTKSTASAVTRVDLDIRFLGVTLSAQLEPAEISADGISQSRMRIWLKETTSNKGIATSLCRVRAAQLPIFLDVSTGTNGYATVPIASTTQAITDTLYVEYGNLLQSKSILKLQPPRLTLTPVRAELLADGTSKLNYSAVLISFKNNPIQGADIVFNCDDGIITGSARTNASGEAIAEFRAGNSVHKNVKIIAQFHAWTDTSWVDLVDTAPSVLEIEAENEVLRDGFTPHEVRVHVVNQLQKPVPGTKIRFTTTRGLIDSTATTDEMGYATVYFIPDAGKSDAEAIIGIKAQGISNQTSIKLLGITLGLSAAPISIPADGLATASVSLALQLTTTLLPLGEQTILLSATSGSIPGRIVTDAQGRAQTLLTAGTTPGIANVRATWGGLQETIDITLLNTRPVSVQLTAEPNFIWVRETGQTDLARITARVYGSSGQLLLQETGIRFMIRNGPHGGEALFPNDGDPMISSVQKTAAGVATVNCKSGIRSGTVEIQAVLADYPDVVARATQLVIRSGPPYIWIDPADPNHVESHMTVALDYFNLEGWNHVRDFKVSIYVGDKYNNPVESGTNIYLTSTAGIVTTDTRTDAEGRGSALWTTANPRPTIAPGDPTTLAPHRIPNPNSPGNMLPVTVPDFEGSLVRNSAGTLGENDGVGLVMASTYGRDQNGNDAIVYGLNMAVFSGMVIEFSAVSNKNSLNPGEYAQILVRIYDLNGNPVAKGSTLTASVNAGQLSATDLMAAAERYGYGSTIFVTTLLNTLDAKVDESRMAEVVFKLDSPNGTGSISIPVFLIGKL